MNSQENNTGVRRVAMDMTDWSILDFELAFDGLHHLCDACVWLENQPRALGENHRYHPGADVVATLKDDLQAKIDDLVDQLHVQRFDDPESEDRRLRLLIMSHADFGERGGTAKEVLDMLMRQVLPKTGEIAHAA